MKLLREYIRRILLTEAAKGPADLPDDIVITIDTKNIGGIAIKYAMASDPNRSAEPFTPVYGDIVIYSLKGHPNYGNCGDAWMVSGSVASSGWGPLLYDVAIEWATMNGGGLISDRATVSRDARNVWSYYMRNRNDVTAHQLDDPFNLLTPEGEDNCDQEVAGGGHSMYGGDKDFGTAWVKSALSKRYTKAPTTMNALKAAGKLVIL
jgi:hypothetical protein